MINPILKNKTLHNILVKIADKNYAGTVQKMVNHIFNSPKILQLHINTQGNFNCEYCYINNRNVETLSLSEIFDLIDQAKKLGIKFIDLLGGEPFMHPNFLEIIQYIYKKGVYVTIFTNGSFLNIEFLHNLKPFKNFLTLVVKYDHKKSYSKQTNTRNLFKKIKKNIKKYTDEGFKVITFTVVTQKNINHINDIIKESIGLGALPMFERYMPVKDSKTNHLLEIKKEEWADVLDQVYELYKPYRAVIKGLAFLKGGVCSCYQNSICVTADGYILPCPETPFELNLGNVKEKPLKKIWKDSSSIRNNWNKIPLECSHCKSKYLCRGGCKAYTYIKNKEFNKKDPLCNADIPSTYTHCVYSLVRIFNKDKLIKQ